MPQDSSHLSGPLSAYARSASIDESLFMTILRKLDFSRSQFDLELEELSAGQKKKLMLAESLCRRAHVYLWDEPLNYIDIYSRMQIEELIKEFSPTMVFVEHDGSIQKRRRHQGHKPIKAPPAAPGRPLRRTAAVLWPWAAGRRPPSISGFPSPF